MSVFFGIIANSLTRRHHHTSIYFRVFDKMLFHFHIQIVLTLLVFVITIKSLLLQKIYVRCFTAHVMTKVIAIILSESDRTC